MYFTETISTLIDAGLSGETLKTVVAALERDMVRYESRAQRDAQRDAHCDAQTVSPGALRMRKLREKQRNLAGEPSVSDVVTPCAQRDVSDNINTSLEPVLKKEVKEESIVGKRARLRNSYSPLFELVWKAYPTDKLMSKLAAWKVFEKLSPEDQQAVVSSIPSFKAHVATLTNYRVVHLCRYISERRFEGFSPASEQTELSTGAVWSEPARPDWDGLEAAYVRLKGKKPPRDNRGGWTYSKEVVEAA